MPGCMDNVSAKDGRGVDQTGKELGVIVPAWEVEV
jgi:hypothetical protein